MIVLEDGVFVRYFSCEGEAPMNEMSALIRDPSKNSKPSFYHVKTQQEDGGL